MLQYSLILTMGMNKKNHSIHNKLCGWQYLPCWVLYYATLVPTTAKLLIQL